MEAPLTYLYSLSIYKFVYLPNLELLSFLAVFALPKHSNIGLHDMIFYSIGIPCADVIDRFLNLVINSRKRFVASVLPAPDSPYIQQA